MCDTTNMERLSARGELCDATEKKRMSDRTVDRFVPASSRAGAGLSDNVAMVGEAVVKKKQEYRQEKKMRV